MSATISSPKWSWSCATVHTFAAIRWLKRRTDPTSTSCFRVSRFFLLSSMVTTRENFKMNKMIIIKTNVCPAFTLCCVCFVSFYRVPSSKQSSQKVIFYDNISSLSPLLELNYFSNNRFILKTFPSLWPGILRAAEKTLEQNLRSLLKTSLRGGYHSQTKLKCLTLKRKTRYTQIYIM